MSRGILVVAYAHPGALLNVRETLIDAGWGRVHSFTREVLVPGTLSHYTRSILNGSICIFLPTVDLRLQLYMRNDGPELKATEQRVKQREEGRL